MDSLPGQLIFLIITAVIWILGEAAKKRRERAEQEQGERGPDALPPQPHDVPPGQVPPGQVPPRQAPAEHPHAPRPNTQQPGGGPQAPRRRRERARDVLEEMLGLPRSQPDVARPRQEPAQTRTADVDVLASSNIMPSPPVNAAGSVSSAEAAVPSSVQRRRAAFHRLGIPSGQANRVATRRAVLWSEVLGPPRALRGPHRPPRARRP